MEYVMELILMLLKEKERIYVLIEQDVFNVLIIHQLNLKHQQNVPVLQIVFLMIVEMVIVLNQLVKQEKQHLIFVKMDVVKQLILIKEQLMV